jgi:membrane protease YdiL (CAAX protease family)
LIKRTFVWLDEEPSLSQLSAWILVSTSIFLAYGEIISQVFQETDMGYDFNPLLPFNVYERLQVAAGEEMVFRATLALPWLIFRKSKVAILGAALLSSYLFALIHDPGNFYNIVFQGIVGFGLCIIFLKCGGMKGKFFQALWVTVSIHFLHNMIVGILGYFIFP